MTHDRSEDTASGHEEVAHTVYDEWNGGDRKKVLAAIDDELLDSIAVGGTPGEARDLLDEFADIEGVDSLSISFPRGASVEQILETMETLAPATDEN